MFAFTLKIVFKKRRIPFSKKKFGGPQRPRAKKIPGAWCSGTILTELIFHPWTPKKGPHLNPGKSQNPSLTKRGGGSSLPWTSHLVTHIEKIALWFFHYFFPFFFFGFINERISCFPFGRDGKCPWHWEFPPVVHQNWTNTSTQAVVVKGSFRDLFESFPLAFPFSLALAPVIPGIIAITTLSTVPIVIIPWSRSRTRLLYEPKSQTWVSSFSVPPVIIPSCDTNFRVEKLRKTHLDSVVGRKTTRILGPGSRWVQKTRQELQTSRTNIGLPFSFVSVIFEIAASASSSLLNSTTLHRRKVGGFLLMRFHTRNPLTFLHSRRKFLRKLVRQFLNENSNATVGHWRKFGPRKWSLRSCHDTLQAIFPTYTLRLVAAGISPRGSE